MAFQEKFNMFDVQYLLGIKTIQKVGNSRYIVCPFCGESSLCCNITESFFNCFSCGRSGNYYTLYADVKGITASGGKTANQIARAMILEELSLNKPVEVTVNKPVKKAKEEKRLSPMELDYVYRELVKNTTMSDKHYKALKSRGLTDKQIKGYGFRSIDSIDGKKLANRGLKTVVNAFDMDEFMGISCDHNYKKWKLRVTIESYYVGKRDLESENL
ncbi:MAG: hypothetical protein K6G88_09140 [Lachnospiraceae bacterium]|nr:hypothetical protein [Lachnospiraceae bacterium]